MEDKRVGPEMDKAKENGEEWQPLEEGWVKINYDGDCNS